ncbi:hypothetical protein CANCADRAFT_31362 [Tortispora caseinolytica NRRL Y-17796]|uniref:Transmembrane protein n=1 Tax=Tortispora caseinolytica NRRL Y-17796 TaxID=767744 RepID=A0A1E4TF20_9ASCO|nr:hypothetical protein CANCADRAFT_31362 [Tortispora caseinolytica NRRL Y-17796]
MYITRNHSFKTSTDEHEWTMFHSSRHNSTVHFNPHLDSRDLESRSYSIRSILDRMSMDDHAIDPDFVNTPSLHVQNTECMYTNELSSQTQPIDIFPIKSYAAVAAHQPPPLAHRINSASSSVLSSSTDCQSHPPPPQESSIRYVHSLYSESTAHRSSFGSHLSPLLDTARPAKRLLLSLLGSRILLAALYICTLLALYYSLWDTSRPKQYPFDIPPSSIALSTIQCVFVWTGDAICMFLYICNRRASPDTYSAALAFFLLLQAIWMSIAHRPVVSLIVSVCALLFSPGLLWHRLEDHICADARPMLPTDLSSNNNEESNSNNSLLTCLRKAIDVHFPTAWAIYSFAWTLDALLCQGSSPQLSELITSWVIALIMLISVIWASISTDFALATLPWLVFLLGLASYHSSSSSMIASIELVTVAAALVVIWLGILCLHRSGSRCCVHLL